MLEINDIVVSKANFSLTANHIWRGGEIIALLGASGSGKSTLLDAISGFATIESGRLIWNGLDMTTLTPDARNTCMIFQNHNLFPRLSVRDNITIGCENIHHGELIKIIEKLDLGELLNRFPRQISGGQAARVAIARALLQNKEIWLLDEPFSALGPKLSRELRELIKSIIKNSTKLAVFVTHQPDELIGFADKVAWIAHKNVNKVCPTAEFFDKPPPDATKYL